MNHAIQAVLLAGPTASGKSALAVALAQRLAGTVINADSMQVYADLRILTARPQAAELAAAPHKLYGHVDGAINYSAARWRDDAAIALNQTWQAGRLPIVVGGTGLYFKTLERGLATMPLVPDAIRSALRAQTEGVDTQLLHQRLAACDPLTAGRLRSTDRQRVLRALEIWQVTGRPLAAWQGEAHSPPLLDPTRCIRVFLTPDRATLGKRIDERFEAMIAAGALEEVRRLMERQLDPALPVMRAHGVPRLLEVLRQAREAADAISAAKAETRRYAKRQFTWFRHQMPGWDAVHPDHARDFIDGQLANSCLAIRAKPGANSR